MGKYKNLLFVHDGPVFYDENGNYYEYSYSGLYDRYSLLAENITFLMRTEQLSLSTKGNLLDRRINVISFPNYLSPSAYFLNKKKAKLIIEKAVKQADVIIVRLSGSGSDALKYIKKYNKPYIYESVGCIWDSLWNHSFVGKFFAPFFFLRVRKEIRDSSYVYYVTNQFLQNRYPTNGKSIGCSNVFIDIVSNDVLEKRLKINATIKGKRKVILGTAAALDVRYKGQQYVIKAIPKLLERGIDIEYRLAGRNLKEDNYLIDLAKSLGVESNIKLVGSLNSSEMEEFFDNIDIYIQPSRQEGLPRSLVEAMSRGLNCLGSKLAGIPELLDNNHLFVPGNVRQIVERVEYVINSNMDEESKKNFNVAKGYNKEILNNRRMEFYKNFIEETLSNV